MTNQENFGFFKFGGMNIIKSRKDRTEKIEFSQDSDDGGEPEN